MDLIFIRTRDFEALIMVKFMVTPYIGNKKYM